jgi:hypothetical protein
MMDVYSITYLLGVAHLLVAVLALALTFKPYVTIFHYAQLRALYSFGIRPILAASVQGYSNYPGSLGWSAYNEGLLYQLGFNFVLSAIYISFYIRKRQKQSEIVSGPAPIYFYATLLVTIGGIIALHIFSKGAWLPGRSGTMNAVAPGTKYILPFAIIGSSTVIPLAAILYVRKAAIQTWILACGIGMATLCLALLYVRGFLIAGVILAGWVIERHKSVNLKQLIGIMIVILLIGNLLRPLGKILPVYLGLKSEDTLVASVVKKVAENMTLMDKARALVLFKTSGDLADTWPIVIEYTKKYGFLNGKTFIAIPMRFLGTGARLSSGILTASDTLNKYYYGSDYETKSYGFNVFLANEFYMNFGILCIPLAAIPGLLMFIFDRWMGRLAAVGIFSLFISYYLYFVTGFINELAAGIQWGVGTLVVAYAVKITAILLKWRTTTIADRQA